ncbi:cupin domain-containing protein [Psychrobacter sp. Ps2]|uniref:cupin domain-containing protein n=1 Tax=Psychrobacter sp. Ps2 TaxID=2790956 RepID=UPI001EE12582|nr:cupin domain-containing protein [Psychrobacter sp. Ps2]
MSSDETQHVVIDTYKDANWQQQGNRNICPLFSDGVEHVSLQRIDAGELLFTETIHGGAEILVVAGELIEGKQVYQQDSWIRLPIDINVQIKAGVEGATIYLKTGHLNHVIGLDIQEA